MVPIVEGWSETYEDPAINSEELRSVHFGLRSHVRYYGRDFRQRIKNAGYEGSSEFALLPSDEIRYSTGRGERVFIARKRQGD